MVSAQDLLQSVMFHALPNYPRRQRDHPHRPVEPVPEVEEDIINISSDSEGPAIKQEPADYLRRHRDHPRRPVQEVEEDISGTRPFDQYLLL